MSTLEQSAAIHHAGESQSNRIRDRLCQSEPSALRTFTSSLAVLNRSAGAYHWTPEGRRLADFTSGVLVANLGHNPVAWWRRVVTFLGISELASQQGRYFQAPPLTAYNAVTELEVRASERLVANMRAQPGGERMEQVMWAASGSEAIQKALWAAMKRRPGQDMILATRGGFHGKKGLAGAITGCETDSERDPRVRFISFPRDDCRSVQRRREPIDLAPYEQELNQLADELSGRLCCLVTEPYLGGGGSYHPQPQYLQLLERFCRQHDLLLILDEIQSNFGRTGPMYAYTHYGITPDIVCLGKGLGNGVPVSAAVGPSAVFKALHYGEGSDTWSANPLASAAVLATLEEFETTNVLEQGQQISEVIERGLLQLAETPLVEQIRGEGCVWGVECCEFAGHSAADVANACVEACYLGDEQGRAIHLLGPLAGKVLRVSPPLTMDTGEAAEYLGVMRDIFAKLADRLAASRESG